MSKQKFNAWQKEQADAMAFVPYTNPILNERELTHGDFNERAEMSQRLKDNLQRGSGYEDTTDCQREALDMICVKLSRIVCGDAQALDHWVDLAGYANLISERLK